MICPSIVCGVSLGRIQSLKFLFQFKIALRILALNTSMRRLEIVMDSWTFKGR